MQPLPQINDTNYSTHLKIIKPSKAEEMFRLSRFVHFIRPQITLEENSQDYLEDGYPEWCFCGGNLQILSLKAGHTGEGSPYNLVVNGNLTVNGTLCWYEKAFESLVYINGDLTAENLLIAGNIKLVVMGNLQVKNLVFTRYGASGGKLFVQGATTARAIVNTTDFNIVLQNPPLAMVVSAPENINCPINALEYCDGSTAPLTPNTISDILLPKFIDAENYYMPKAREIALALEKGEAVLL